jgi:hypothetical protein
MASPPPTRTTPQTSPGQEQRDAEVAAARAAQAQAEQEARQKEDVWHVAIIINKTSGPIPYQILEKGSSTTYTLPPGYQLTHTALNGNIDLKYDYKYEAGYQELQETLEGTRVVGHAPTESEKQNATIYYSDAPSALSMRQAGHGIRSPSAGARKHSRLARSCSLQNKQTNQEG